MSEAFWQAKIRGIVKNFNFEFLNQQERDKIPDAEPYWNRLEQVLAQDLPPWETIKELATQITDASDRAILNRVQLNLDQSFSKVTHLLSGEPLELNLSQYISLRGNETDDNEQDRINNENRESNISSQELFWWLWRCLPEIACQSFDDSVLLTSAIDILPDVSLWSDRSLTAAMAGALMGYQEHPSNDLFPQLPHLVTFSFSPVQELIKASRKMRDFWAGSWVLHYLSAKICRKLANKYGPDSIIYPSLFQQPLIDLWIREKWTGLQPWVKPPQHRALLTAGFPNVIVALLPSDAVQPAMQNARRSLIEEWLNLSRSVYGELERRRWTRELQKDSSTWEKWLKHQWQTYWTALPIASNKANKAEPPQLTKAEPPQLTNSINAVDWLKKLNKICNLLSSEKKLFQPAEQEFIRAVMAKHPDLEVNVGSWWPYIFDQLRLSASTVKNSRNWKIPTAFLPRSTISGIGSVVYNKADEADQEGKKPATEAETAVFWEQDRGLFDGIEELNATETLKRGLHRVLPEILFPKEECKKYSSEEQRKRFPEFYPDLSSGVAGWLRTHPKCIDYFLEACEYIKNEFDWTYRSDDNNTRDEPPANLPWGIPWVDESDHELPNPRLLNSGWLIDDFHPDNPEPDKPFTLKKQKHLKQEKKREVQQAIAQYFKTGNNPTDWYVIAAGDGDGMGEWLKGKHLKDYQDYMDKMPTIPESADSETEQIYRTFENLKEVQKRMGPSTHNALSRALLDFSNQLVPYLTEQRYAGRLIYSGGDDVLAYTNLWEWDRWLWDIHECFRGATDPQQQRLEDERFIYHFYNDGYFQCQGDYWQRQGEFPTKADGQTWQPRLSSRPLFTMGKNKASLSFGVVIAHHSVPLAIALENLWAAEAGAKQYECGNDKKDAVQVRVIFGNGNILKATSQFKVFHHWCKLLNGEQWDIEASIFEQAAQLWRQHPAPVVEAILPWTISFCQRRDALQTNESTRQDFQEKLGHYLQILYQTTTEKQQDKEIQNWLKLAAFTLRNRKISWEEIEDLG